MAVFLISSDAFDVWYQFCCISHRVWYVVLLFQPEGNLSAFKCVISYDVHCKGFKVLQLCKFSWCTVHCA